MRERIGAIDSTLRKLQRGEPVGITCFYERAGVDPPVNPGPTAKVQEELERLLIWARTQPWQGRRGPTLRAIYITLIDEGLRHGTEHRDGIEISISVRELSERANVWDQATRQALKRLVDDGFLKRSRGSDGDKSGRLVLIRSPIVTVTNGNLSLSSDPAKIAISHHTSALPPYKGRKNVVTYHPTFRQGIFGLMAPIILDSLELLGGSATLFEIAKAVERRPQGLRKPISKLVDHNVVLLQDDGRYTLADDASEALDKAAEVSGVAEMLERQRTFYAEERKRYEEVFKPILRGKQ
jgi:hypothetical protein